MPKLPLSCAKQLSNHPLNQWFSKFCRKPLESNYIFAWENEWALKAHFYTKITKRKQTESELLANFTAFVSVCSISYEYVSVWQNLAHDLAHVCQRVPKNQAFLPKSNQWGWQRWLSYILWEVKFSHVLSLYRMLFIAAPLRRRISKACFSLRNTKLRTIRTLWNRIFQTSSHQNLIGGNFENWHT